MQQFKLTFYSFLVLLFFSIKALGQNAKSTNSNDELTADTRKASSADKLYHNLGYRASVDEFLRDKEESNEKCSKIANAYRLNHDTENAAIWYSKYINETQNKIDYLHYAQVLQSNGDSKGASKYYEIYAQELKDNQDWDHIANILATRVEDGDRFKAHAVVLRNESDINTNSLEFSPTFYGDEIVFVSTKRPDKLPSIAKDKWTKENFMSLFKATKSSNGQLSNSTPFAYSITSKYHEGPAAFSKSQSKIYFTRSQLKSNKKRRKNEKGETRLDIYAADRDGKEWTGIESLSFNTEKSDECHPALSPDGKTIIFASNRMEGYGGMDLYKSTYQGSEWSDPINLGEDINTAGNEVFPYIHENGMIFFASNGHDGLGGLDIFYTTTIAQGYKGPENVGTPFNSPKDDFGFVIDSEGTFGFLTSARVGGQGKDDIYSFELPGNPFSSTTISVCTKDHATGEILAGTAVHVSNSALSHHPDHIDQKNARVYESDANGIVEIEMAAFSSIELNAQREGYIDESTIYHYLPNNRTDDGKICLMMDKVPAVPEPVEVVVTNLGEGSLDPNKTVESVAIEENVYFDFDESYLTSVSEEILDRVVDLLYKYPTIKIEVGSYTDARGSKSYNLGLSDSRTASTVRYLQRRGISSDRIVSERYGEFRPWNHCRDGINCDERAHQYNRRSHLSFFNVPQHLNLKMIDNLPIGNGNGKNKVDDIPSDWDANKESNQSDYDDINYRVIVGSYKYKSGAKKKTKKLEVKGFRDIFIYENQEMDVFSVCIGDFNSRSEARQTVTKLKEEGIKSFSMAID